MATSWVRGDVEVTAALRAMGKGPAARDIDAAANIAMKPMLAETKLAMVANRNYVGKYPNFPQPRVPRKGGFVDAGVGIRADLKSPTRRSYKMGAITRRARFLLHLLEFGTAPHFQPNFRGGFMHPGAAPNPALVPAFESGKAGVVRVFGVEIVARIERQARDLGLRVRRR